MADGVAITAGAGTTIATDDCGAAGHAQIVKLGIATDGSATAIPADKNGLLVKSATAANLNATVVGTGTFAVQAALAAGTNNIGDVDVLTVPADPFGANADAASATGSISAKLRFIAATGIPITGTVTVGSHAVTNAGTFAVQNTPVAASTATLANVAAATSSTTLQASNANRLGLRIFNDSTDTVYVKFGSAASATSFTYRLGAGEAVELPVAGSRYTGIVTGLWTGTNGSARMTELSA